MIRTISKANRVILNRGADFLYMDETAMASFGHCSPKDFPAMLDAIGADEVVVDYRTVSEPKARERDRKTLSKRLANLGPGWVVGEWAVKVVDGHVFPDTFECVLNRVAVEAMA